MDMVLAKSDIGIASRYAELVADAALRERIFGAHPRGDERRSVRYLLAITGQQSCWRRTRCSRAASATASPTSIP